MDQREALGAPSRLRDRLFADAAKEVGARALARLGNTRCAVTPEAVKVARKIAHLVYSAWRYGATLSDESVLKKVRQKLEQPDIRRAIRDVYAMRGLDEAQAVDIHIAHILGMKREVIDKDGQVVTVQDPPNYAALKDYQKMTLPQEPRRVQVDSRSVNVHVQSDEPIRVGPPPMRTRLLPQTSKIDVPQMEKKAKVMELE